MNYKFLKIVLPGFLLCLFASLASIAFCQPEDSTSGVTVRTETSVPTATSTDTDNTVKQNTSDTASVTKTSRLLSNLDKESSSTETVNPWALSGSKIVLAIFIFIVGYFVIRYSGIILEAIAEKRLESRLKIKAVIPVIRIFGWTFVLYFIIARVFAPPIETLLALTASAGIAVGFASQDILKNIFGGIVILFDRPFQVGDKIEVGHYYGEVVSIGLRTVRIVTPDDSIVSVPNSEIVNQSVSNANVGEANCQVVAEFFLPPHIDTGIAAKLAKRCALVSPYIYINKPVAVVFKNEVHEGRSLIKMRLKAYVLDIRFEFAFMSDMTKNVLNEFLQRELIHPDDLMNTVRKTA